MLRHGEVTGITTGTGGTEDIRFAKLILIIMVITGMHQCGTLTAAGVIVQNMMAAGAATGTADTATTIIIPGNQTAIVLLYEGCS